jgi:DNA-binding XRE family transcriptional regulator
MYAVGSQGQKVSLKEIRDRLDLTQGELAELLGTKQSNISALERGKEIPDWLIKAIQLHRLLSRAGYCLDDLILSLPDHQTGAKDGADCQ